MSDERVRVIRVLEFIGPKEWIETTLRRSYVTGDVTNTLGEGREARELARIQEILTVDTDEEYNRQFAASLERGDSA